MAKRKNGALTYGRKEKLAGGTEARYNPGGSVNKAGFCPQISVERTTMMRFAVTAIFILACLGAPLKAQQSTPPAGQVYQLKPTPKTVAWGYYDAKTPPVLRIKSGDTVEIQTLIASNPERFESVGIAADQIEPAMRDIFLEVKEKGPGPHILTGPIFIEGAEPGDALEVRIQQIRLAIPYAINAPFCPGAAFCRTTIHTREPKSSRSMKS